METVENGIEPDINTDMELPDERGTTDAIQERGFQHISDQ